MRITVTQKDIDEGKVTTPVDCPLALAIARATGKPVRVGWASVWGLRKNGAGIKLPKKAFNFRQAFDAKEPVQPFAFTMRAR